MYFQWGNDEQHICSQNILITKIPLELTRLSIFFKSIYYLLQKNVCFSEI